MSGFHIDAFFEEISKKNTQGNQMNTHDMIELPPLPEDLIAQAMTDSEVRALLKRYGERCIEADRKRRGGPTAAEISDVIREITGCPDIKNGEDSLVVALGILFRKCATTQSSEPDYKQLFEQMCERCDALDAKLAEYSEREPVGYIMPTAIKQLKAGGHAVVGGVSQGFDVPIYTAPQPAESCASLMSDKTACGSENGDCDSQPAEAFSQSHEPQTSKGGFPIVGEVYFRESTNEWVLELSGIINDTNFNVRHSQPANTAPEDVPSLATLYATTEPVHKTDWNAELSSWSDEDFIHIFHERPDLANRLRKILAEPVKVPSDADILFTMRHLERHLKCIDGAIPTLLSTARALLARYGQHAQPAKSSLKVSYDDKGDCLYVVCDSNEPADAEEDDKGILYRRAISDGRLVGITIMNFMGRHAESRYGKGTP